MREENTREPHFQFHDRRHVKPLATLDATIKAEAESSLLGVELTPLCTQCHRANLPYHHWPISALSEEEEASMLWRRRAGPQYNPVRAALQELATDAMGRGDYTLADGAGCVLYNMMTDPHFKPRFQTPPSPCMRKMSLPTMWLQWLKVSATVIAFVVIIALFSCSVYFATSPTAHMMGMDDLFKDTPHVREVIEKIGEIFMVAILLVGTWLMYREPECP